MALSAVCHFLVFMRAQWMNVFPAPAALYEGICIFCCYSHCQSSAMRNILLLICFSFPAAICQHNSWLIQPSSGET
jgi:hypothetical protein